MRRGLIEWSKDELPAAVFDARLAAVRNAMTEAGIDAAVAYTNFTRPSAVSWLVGFIPYWSECVLIVPRSSATTMVSAVSPRGRPWIASTTPVEELVFTPRVGPETARILRESLPARATIGVIERDDVPAAVGLALAELDVDLQDATELFAARRLAGDAAHTALARNAAQIAHDALAAVAAGETSATAAIAAVDRTARARGAEESYVAIVPDLRTGAHFVRLEGDANLADAFAVRATVAYKGAWVRMIRTVVRGDARAVAEGNERFAGAIARLPALDGLAAMERWLVESTRAAEPLAALAGSAIGEPATIPGGAIVSVQAATVVQGIPVVFGSPAIAGGANGAGSFLVAPHF